MLDKGAEVDRADEEQRSNAAVHRLLQGPRRRGAAVAGQGCGGRPCEEERTALFIACWKGHVDAAQLLLDNGAEVDRAKENGFTPLFIACQKGHVDAARLLLEKARRSIGAMKGGRTPLFAACWKGHVDVAQLLLDKGAEVDQADEDGFTPLFVACQKGHVDAVVVAGQRRKGRSGEQERCDAAMDRLLRWPRRRGAAVVGERRGGRSGDKGRPVRPGEPPACRKGHVDAARLLPEKGAAVDRANEDGRNAAVLRLPRGPRSTPSAAPH